ncbi:PREDICTED: ras-related protein Rab-20 isoform X1 [Cercocebus atys]|uniref:ras-related protein Rab-20 isoform X1 n=1 Tax=Cercocebus atys TaxID=9531 RepID=UPI0005F55AD6|nr:PREDICTED: ras-related protein Rab-20 isoform X1 [Cercocebus atys]
MFLRPGGQLSLLEESVAALRPAVTCDRDQVDSIRGRQESGEPGGQVGLRHPQEVQTLRPGSSGIQIPVRERRCPLCPKNTVNTARCCVILAGREQFHGLGSMYCRGAAAIILTYDVNHPQSLVELEDRFLGLTDTASKDCLFAIVGNKVDLTEEGALAGQEKEKCSPDTDAGDCVSPRVPKQVQLEDAVALYKKILKYKMLDEQDVPAAEQMCFETSAKTGYNVDLLFETLFDLVVPMILQQRAERPSHTVDISSQKPPKRTRSGCCA